MAVFSSSWIKRSEANTWQKDPIPQAYMQSLRWWVHLATAFISLDPNDHIHTHHRWQHASTSELPDQVPNNNTIYALVIGINQYPGPSFEDLECAVGDADDMEEFLLKTLKVSPDNLISLRGTADLKAHQGQATRQGILNGFQKLELISGKTEEPCIIIFYAGHGSSAPRPQGWEDWATDTTDIEMLCPSDIGMEIEGPEGVKWVVEGIPDRTICSFLNQLSEKRGNNITLILDCCCSAGLNRHERDTSRARYLRNPPPITAKQNSLYLASASESTQELAPLKTRAMRVVPGFGGRFDQSHVLLAACGRDRQAFEINGHGIFTRALIKFFESKSLEGETYNTLMHSLMMPSWQTPHCTGANADRPLFNRRGKRTDPSYIPCKRIKDLNGQIIYTLCAGLAEGIAVGEQFSIHENVPFEGEAAPEPLLSAMSAHIVGTTSTVLEFPPAVAGQKQVLPELPRIFYAKRIDWRNDLTTIYCKDRDLINAIFLPGVLEGQLIMITLASKPEIASLILTVDGDLVHIDSNDPLIKGYVPSRFPYPLRRDAPEDIRSIIGAWRHFNYHLHRRGQNEFPQVRMELRYLEPLDDYTEDEYVRDYRPIGKNLLAEEPAHIYISEADNFTMLGMTLYNSSGHDVYPYLFYFDPNDLTITPWTLSAQGAGPGHVDAPLLQHSQLSLGYGNGGSSPWQFCFDGDRTKDIGFFKLFISTSPANFSCLAQRTSPFQRLGLIPDMPPDRSESHSAEGAESLEELNADSWGVKVASVIQIKR